MHHQGRLHAEHGAVTGIRALYLAGHQTVADIVEFGPAVFLGNGRGEQAELAHFIENIPVEALVPVHFEHPGHQLVLGIIPRGIANQPLFLAELVIEKERIVPLELNFVCHGLPLRTVKLV